MKNPVEKSLGFHLWHAALKWKANLADRLKPFELTPTQFFVLGSLKWLGRDGVAPNQRELAEHAGLDPMTASQVVRALEGRKLVRRVEDPADSRSWKLELTRAGETVAHEATAASRASEEKFFAGLPGQRGAFLEALKVLVER
jgi:DNA-binding MarR family transcriptional regulator